MEVHHHAHPSTSSGHRKRWTHYFWEFLMLFLAVFCGFLAENEREHIIEHKREKKFAKQLLDDLRKDSAFFVKRQTKLERTFSSQDSFKELLVQHQASDFQVLKGFIAVYQAFDAPLTTTTFTQMKSSGALRYIRNFELTAELQEYYDVLAERIISHSTLTRAFLLDYLTPWYIKHIRAQDIDPMTDSIINPRPVILDRTEKTDQELLNITDSYRYLCIAINKVMDNPAVIQINKLIAMIKKEYRLK